MAKEEKEKKQTEEQEKQIPEKPKKKSGGMSTPVILGIIGGIVVFQAVLIFFLFKFFIVPQQQPVEHDAAHAEKDRAAEVKDEEKDHENKNWEYDEFTLDPKLVHTYETGRITTNPKSSEKFVIVNLAIEYIVKNEESLEEINAELAAHGGGDDEGDPSLFTHKKKIRIKGKINSMLGGLSVDELFAKRDSLPSIFKEGLAEVINDHHMKVKDVIIQEFMIQ